jgi:hypothetical protein
MTNFIARQRTVLQRLVFGKLAIPSSSSWSMNNVGLRNTGIREGGRKGRLHQKTVALKQILWWSTWSAWPGNPHCAPVFECRNALYFMYGPPHEQTTVETRSHFLSPVKITVRCSMEITYDNRFPFCLVAEFGWSLDWSLDGSPTGQGRISGLVSGLFYLGLSLRLVRGTMVSRFTYVVCQSIGKRRILLKSIPFRTHVTHTWLWLIASSVSSLSWRILDSFLKNACQVPIVSDAMHFAHLCSKRW